MSALEQIGKGLRGQNTLSFLYCYGISHFWRAGAYQHCRCLCGKRHSGTPQSQYAHHIIFGMDERHPQGWYQKAQDEYLRENGYVKRSEYEKTFIFDPITGVELQRATRGPAEGSD